MLGDLRALEILLRALAIVRVVLAGNIRVIRARRSGSAIFDLRQVDASALVEIDLLQRVCALIDVLRSRLAVGAGAGTYGRRHHHQKTESDTPRAARRMFELRVHESVQSLSKEGNAFRHGSGERRLAGRRSIRHVRSAGRGLPKIARVDRRSRGSSNRIAKSRRGELMRKRSEIQGPKSKPMART